MKYNKLIITINKPLGQVFAFCITPPKAKLWVPNIVNETTNEWPVKVGTIYTEYKSNNSFFKIIVTDQKENEYIEWKTEDDNYHVRYEFRPIDQNTTELEYVETGDVSEPFTQEILRELKEAIEND